MKQTNKHSSRKKKNIVHEFCSSYKNLIPYQPMQTSKCCFVYIYIISILYYLRLWWTRLFFCPLLYNCPKVSEFKIGDSREVLWTWKKKFCAVEMFVILRGWMVRGDSDSRSTQYANIHNKIFTIHANCMHCYGCLFICRYVCLFVCLFVLFCSFSRFICVPFLCI